MNKYGYILIFEPKLNNFPYYWSKNNKRIYTKRFNNIQNSVYWLEKYVSESEKQQWLFNQKLDKILE